MLEHQRGRLKPVSRDEALDGRRATTTAFLFTIRGTFRYRMKPSNEDLPTIMDLAKMGGLCKRKGGRASRLALKKKNTTKAASNLQISLEGPERGGCAPPTLEKETITSAVIWQDDKRENMVLDPYEGEERESHVVPGPYTEARDGLLGPREERETEMLGLYEGLGSGIMFLNDIMGNGVVDPNGVMSISEEKEGVIDISLEMESGVSGYNKGKTGTEKESGVILSSNGESSEWCSSSSITSSLDDGWVDWDWEGVLEGHKLWEEGNDQEMFSFLGGRDNDEGKECRIGG
ncbi:hypothetical protein HHK36_012315 [Tetracentron sinense]|uniref:Uncharacterized protein n=1 Tax=Tetracentron sinense TaxID=13715 RepID=A0A834ZF51_TETSI|nr:hypothetical protein HHK36_012315 [Tetracentron sinense]